MDLEAGEPKSGGGETAALAEQPLIFGFECRHEAFDGGGIIDAAFGRHGDLVDLQ